jgi:hypothetical protein
VNLPKNKQIIGLGAWLAVCFIAAAIGSAASVRAGSFFTHSWGAPDNPVKPEAASRLG